MEKTLLNLIPGACSPEVHLSQYDKGRAIPFKLAEGKSAYSVPDGSEIVVEATKPSGLGFVVPVTFDGDTATMTITETMSNEYGRFPAELSITKNGNKIGTANFVMNIERSPHPEGTTDGDAETIIPELTLLVERIEAAAEDVDEKSELFLNLSAEAETLPAGSPATASYSNGVLTLGIPRGYDGDDTKADAIVKSASGEVASFTDGGNGLLVKSLIANITPKQSGSGDPSPTNIRSISGWSEVNTEVAGKNLFNPNLNSGLLGTDAGTNDTTVTPSNRYGYSEKIPATLSCKLSFKTNDLEKFNWICVMRYIDGIATERVYSTLINHQQKEQVNIPAVANSYIRVLVGANSGKTVGTTPSGEIQIELGSTPTSYEPYNGTTYTTSLGQTVYGGTLDVVSGVLTLTKGFVDLGSLNWTLRTQWTPGNRFLSNEISNKKAGSYNILCSQYKPMQERVSITDTGQIAPANNTNSKDMVVRDDRYSDATAFKNAVSGVQLVYELATPTEIQLTPTQVTTLLGNNNIWADSGSVEVEYRADTTLAYNELLSLIASLS